MHGKNHPKMKCNKTQCTDFLPPSIKTDEDSNHPNRTTEKKHDGTTQAAPPGSAAPEPSNRTTRQKKATARGITRRRSEVWIKKTARGKPQADKLIN